MAKKGESIMSDDEKVTNPAEELVELPPLFYDKERYSAPVFVGYNEKQYLIPRGKSGIRVPRAVREILEQSEYQKQMATRYSASIEGDHKLADL